MSDAVVEKLMAEITDLKAEAKSRRLEGKKLKADLDAIRTERDGLAAERDTFRAKAEAGPKELTDRIAELEGSIRERDHRDAFASVKEFEVPGQDGKAAKYKLADGASIDALWQLTGYKPEGGRPEGEAITGRFGEAFKAHPYLFSEVKPADAGKDAAGAAAQPITTARREAGPGAFGKGVNDSTASRPGPGNGAPVFRDGIPGKI